MTASGNPFTVLGVSHSATMEEIRSAYRRLAKLTHPDQGHESSPDRFHQIKNAYDTLCDPVKRAQAEREFLPRGKDMSSAFSDFFETLHRTGRGREVRSARKQAAGGGKRNLVLTLEQAFHGGMFPVPGGGGETCSQCQGKGLEVSLSRVPCPDCEGMGFTRRVDGMITVEVDCPTCAGEGIGNWRLCSVCSGAGTSGNAGEVRIPPGCRDGYRVAIGERNSGWPGQGTTIEVKVQPHDRFERVGENLETVLEVPVWRAALGGTEKIAGIDGSIVSFPVPAGAQDGDRIEIVGQGMPAFSGRGVLGVTLSISIPDANQNPQVKKAFEALRDALASEN